MNMDGFGARVDVHAHVSPAPYLDKLNFYAEKDDTLRPVADWYPRGFSAKLPADCGQFMFGELSARLPGLDAAGIRIQVISPGSSLQYPGATRYREELVTSWNTAVHEEVAAHPERFRVLAGLPLPDVEGSLREIDRVIERDGHVGFCITSHFDGMGIDEPRWAPVFTRLNETQSVVFVHPAGFRVAGLLERSLNVDLGTQFDDVLTVVSLYTGLAARYRNIRWVVAHLGGAFPFLLERLDEHWERDREISPLPAAPSQLLENVYFESAGHGHRAIEFAANTFSPQQLLLGTDFPMVTPSRLDELVARSLSGFGPSTQLVAAVHNPQDLFRLDNSSLD